VTDPYLPARIRALQSETVRRRHLELLYFLEKVRAEKGVACPGCRFLAEVFDVGPSTVCRWLHVLRDAGLLTWTKVRSTTQAFYRFFHSYKTVTSIKTYVSHSGTNDRLQRLRCLGKQARTEMEREKRPTRAWNEWQEEWAGDLTEKQEDELRRSRG